jgi:hypothetical protein
MFTRLSTAILYALLVVTAIASTAAAAPAAATSAQWKDGVSLASHQNLIILT